ncbi:MAG: winged helix-turn-helix domain-containing protein [Acholeplasmataceae bacterium]
MDRILILTDVKRSFFGLIHEMGSTHFRFQFARCELAFDVDLRAYDSVILNLDCNSDRVNRAIIANLMKRADLPLLVVSERKSEHTRSYYLDLGADGFIEQPIAAIATSARIRALLRRFKYHQQKPLNTRHIGPFVIDYDNRTISTRGKQLPLTNKEFELARILIENANTVVGRERLIQLIYAVETSATDNALNIRINRLRSKLGSNCDGQIETIWGVGYRFDLAISDRTKA